VTVSYGERVAGRCIRGRCAGVGEGNSEGGILVEGLIEGSGSQRFVLLDRERPIELLVP